MEISDRAIVEAIQALRGGARQAAHDQYGYAVEFAIKATFMRRRGLNRWPDSQDAPHLYIHGLEALMKHTGIFQRLCADRQKDSRLRSNWLIVKDWAPARYIVDTPSPKVMSDLHRAITEEPGGVLAWLKRQ